MNDKIQNQNEPKDGEKPKTGGNPFVGFFLGLLLVLLLNALVFPRVGGNRIIPTDYGTFVAKVDSGLVRQVVIEKDNIYFSADTAEGKTVTFQTGAVDDPELVDRLLQASSPGDEGKIVFTKRIPRENSALLDFVLWWVLPGVLMYFVWRQISRTMQARMGGGGPGNFMSFGSSGARIYAESEVKTTFADVAGQDEAKEALTEIVDFLHNPGKYAEIGASLPKGALLVGPPGTGKTLIARAVAGEAKVPFFSISGSEFVQMFVGMGAAKVRDLFKQAGEKAPCITGVKTKCVG